MKGKLSARYLTEESYPRWNRLVAASPQGSIYSTPAYLDILCRAVGGRFKILGVFRADDLIGGVALYEAKSMFGTAVSNRLLLYYNSLVLAESRSRYPAQRTKQELEILSLLEQTLSRAGYARLRLHNRWPLCDLRPFLARGWDVRPAYSYLARLDDLETLHGRIDKNFRRLINRCGSEGVTVAADDDFDSFYRLHYQTHLRKGAPLYLPQEAFRRYVHDLQASRLCRLYHARLPDGRSTATQLVLLGEHPVTHTVCAGAEPEWQKLGTTPYLRWRVFEQLAELGYAGNDLTDAALNPVTRFKSQLGAELTMNMVISRPDQRIYKIGQDLTQFSRRLNSYIRRRIIKRP
ncbi:GNAT family N-acetyltransferase [Candidatus Zixiibacteriota bacterium]